MRLIIGWMLALVFLPTTLAVAQNDVAAKPVVGLRDNRPAKFALTNARVFLRPGEQIDNATVLVQGTSITSVGQKVVVPPGFLVIDCTGQSIYPGLIDAYGEVEVPRSDDKLPGHWNSNITPHRSASDVAAGTMSESEKLRSQGITSRLIAPKYGIIKGSSCVVLTGTGDSGRVLLKPSAWQHLSLTVPTNRPRSDYPNSPMGAVALLRQTLYDATWYADAWRTYRASTSLPRPETNLALDQLSRSLADGVFVVDAPNERMALRAGAIAQEFSLNIVLRGSGREYRELDALAAQDRKVLVPVAFADKPEIANQVDANDVSLRDLMHWDLGPENPARLDQAGVEFCLTTDDLENTQDFLKNVRLAVKRGLDPDVALAAVTTRPAKWLGLDATTGEIRSGMLASFVITDGDLFDEETKLLQTWVAGEQFILTPTEPKAPDALQGRWQLAFSVNGKPTDLILEMERKDGKWKGRLSLPSQEQDADIADRQSDDDEPADEEEATEAKTEDADESSEDPKVAELKQLVRQPDQMTANVRLSDLGEAFPAGIWQLSLVSVVEGNETTTVLGSIRLPDGTTEKLKIAFADPETTDNKSVENTADEKTDESSSAGRDGPIASTTPLLYPLGAYGRTEPVVSPPAVLFRGATVWTCGDAGILESADVLVRDGMIAQVGSNLPVPENCQIIDARGKHITPGLIDCHSHMATDGGVNESGQVVTAEVRIGDFIDHTDINIYRQLAGGVTTSNILHGSANPIGGQNQVIKLRWGQGMDDLRMKQAPAGIKFALGENVKRNQSRYPNTRMGVEQLIRDQLLAAREYDRAWRDHHAGRRTGLPPRRDLQLDAMVEVQRGKRWIHCHSYRQDEIVATLDLLEEFGIQIGTLQHILEGYKVADRMVKHGAMASSFSDWWAYKFEVFDAIPYNGALMHEQGIVVSFNSDDRELARHLNTEAAKAIKYGGVSAEEALKFVTLNPAKQLRIDQHVGSVETGKHADLVLWSGPPLSTLSRCEQTWIDGQRLFDLDSDREMKQRDADLHAALVQKVLDDQSGTEQTANKAKPKKVDEEDRWVRHDIYCTANGENGHQHTQWERRK